VLAAAVVLELDVVSANEEVVVGLEDRKLEMLVAALQTWVLLVNEVVCR
jgi:hypothetical protein